MNVISPNLPRPFKCPFCENIIYVASAVAGGQLQSKFCKDCNILYFVFKDNQFLHHYMIFISNESDNFIHVYYGLDVVELHYQNNLMTEVNFGDPISTLNPIQEKQNLIDKWHNVKNIMILT